MNGIYKSWAELKESPEMELDVEDVLRHLIGDVAFLGSGKRVTEEEDGELKVHNYGGTNEEKLRRNFKNRHAAIMNLLDPERKKDVVGRRASNVFQQEKGKIEAAR